MKSKRIMTTILSLLLIVSFMCNNLCVFAEELSANTEENLTAEATSENDLDSLDEEEKEDNNIGDEITDEDLFVTEEDIKRDLSDMLSDDVGDQPIVISEENKVDERSIEEETQEEIFTPDEEGIFEVQDDKEDDEKPEKDREEDNLEDSEVIQEDNVRNVEETVITELSFSGMSIPTFGEEVSYSIDGGDGLVFSDVYWEEETAYGNQMYTESVFGRDRDYCLVVGFSVKEGYRFPDDMNQVVVNVSDGRYAGGWWQNYNTDDNEYVFVLLFVNTGGVARPSFSCIPEINVGETPTFDFSEFSFGDHVRFVSVSWTDESMGETMQENAVFAQDHRYSVTVQLEGKDNWYLGECNWTPAYIKNVSDNRGENESAETVTYTLQYIKFPAEGIATINQIDVSGMETPVLGGTAVPQEPGLGEGLTLVNFEWKYGRYGKTTDCFKPGRNIAVITARVNEGYWFYDVDENTKLVYATDAGYNRTLLPVYGVESENYSSNYRTKVVSEEERTICIEIEYEIPFESKVVLSVNVSVKPQKGGAAQYGVAEYDEEMLSVEEGSEKWCEFDAPIELDYAYGWPILDGDSYRIMSEGDDFISGKYYLYTFNLISQHNLYDMVDFEQFTVSANGELRYTFSDEKVTIVTWWETAVGVIDKAEIAVEEPIVGENPSTSFVFSCDGARAKTIEWYKDTNYDYANSIRLSENDVFEKGERYYAFVFVELEEGCSFSDWLEVKNLQQDSSGFPDFTYIEGEPVIVVSFSSLGMVYPNFSSIHGPQSGEKPGDISFDICNQHIDVSSVVWIDKTSGDAVVAENDAFIEGHQYSAVLTVETQAGYYFYDYDYISYPEEAIGGNVLIVNPAKKWEITINYPSIPNSGDKAITEIKVEGIVAPVVGATCCTDNITVTEGLVITGAEWYYRNRGKVETGVFEDSRAYVLHIIAEVNEGYYFQIWNEYYAYTIEYITQEDGTEAVYRQVIPVNVLIDDSTVEVNGWISAVSEDGRTIEISVGSFVLDGPEYEVAYLKDELSIDLSPEVVSGKAIPFDMEFIEFDRSKFYIMQDLSIFWQEVQFLESPDPTLPIQWTYSRTMKEGDKFEDGHYYALCFYVNAINYDYYRGEDRYEDENGPTIGQTWGENYTIHGENIFLNHFSFMDKHVELVTIYTPQEAEATVVDEVFVSVNNPVPGMAPEYNYSLVGEGIRATRLEWYESGDDELRLLTEDDVFERGKGYTAYLYIELEEGYSFPDGSIWQLDVKTPDSSDCSSLQAVNLEDEDKDVIKLWFDDVGIVNFLRFENIGKPERGEMPSNLSDYTGKHFHVLSYKWMDKTDNNRVMDPTDVADVFQVRHQYALSVVIEVDANYDFSDYVRFEKPVGAVKASGNVLEEKAKWEVEFLFPLVPDETDKPLNEIVVYGVTAPTVGGSTDTSGISLGEGLVLQSAKWLYWFRDEVDSAVFVDSRSYDLRIRATLAEDYYLQNWDNYGIYMLDNETGTYNEIPITGFDDMDGAISGYVVDVAEDGQEIEISIRLYVLDGPEYEVAYLKDELVVNLSPEVVSGKVIPFDMEFIDFDRSKFYIKQDLNIFWQEVQFLDGPDSSVPLQYTYSRTMKEGDTFEAGHYYALCFFVNAINYDYYKNEDRNSNGGSWGENETVHGENILLSLYNFMGKHAELVTIYAVQESTPEPIKDGWYLKDGYWYYYQNGEMLKDSWMKDSQGWHWLGSDGKMLTDGWARDSKGWMWMDASGNITKSKWIQYEEGWYYLKADGYRATNEWCKDSQGWHWIEQNGRMLTNGWAKDSTGWCWVDASGNMVYSKWVKDGDYWYYIKSDGYRAENEWCKDSQGWHWIDADGHMLTNGWAKDSKGSCWMDADGNMVYSQWIETDDGTYYINAKGYKASSEWYKDDQGWHWVDANGQLLKNSWAKDSQGWHWLDENGTMLTNGWAKDSAGWCWMDADGNMVYSQWIETDEGTYYVNAKGYRASNEWCKDSQGWHWIDVNGLMLKNGWAKDSTGWCWMDSNGNMSYSRWVNDGEYWYYIKSSGYRAENEWCKDGQGWHWIDADGRMLTNGWAKDSTGWCWMDADGNMVYGQWVETDEGTFYVNAKGYRAENEWYKDTQGWHWIDADGQMLTNGWAKDSTGWCWMDADGNMVYSKWVETDGGTYYVNAKGYRVTGEQEIDGKVYSFDSDGKLIA